MFKASIVVSALVLSAAAGVSAQTKTIPGEMTTVTATVQAVELQTRTLTLKKSDGTFVTLVVPTSYERFPQTKVGDIVTARYLRQRRVPEAQPGREAGRHRVWRDHEG